MLAVRSDAVKKEHLHIHKDISYQHISVDPEQGSARGDCHLLLCVFVNSGNTPPCDCPSPSTKLNVIVVQSSLLNQVITSIYHVVGVALFVKFEIVVLQGFKFRCFDFLFIQLTHVLFSFGFEPLLLSSKLSYIYAIGRVI